MAVVKAITTGLGLSPKIKIKLLGFLNEAKDSLKQFKPDLTDKASKQDLKFSNEGKSSAQDFVEKGLLPNIAATVGSFLPGLTCLSDIASPFIGFGSNCGCFGSNSDTWTKAPFHSLTISLYGNSIPDLSDIAFAYLPVAYFAIMILGNKL